MPGNPKFEEVTFPCRMLKLAGHLYRPVPGSPDRKGAALVIVHPWTSIKEQSPANYARELTSAGFTCLAYDAAYQGESEGEPRSLEDPYQRVEDIKAAITYLQSVKGVDMERIGNIGICAGGGHAPAATQTDLRIKACATSTAVCVGTMAHRRFDKDSSNETVLQAQLENAAKDRMNDITGEKVEIVHMLPAKISDFPADAPASFRDLAEYYRNRAPHKRAPNESIPRSWDIMANFDAFGRNDMISPRPLLMITGTAAATKWYSEDAIAKAKEPKGLMVIDGLTHADLYDHVDIAGPKMADFFAKALA